MTLLKTDFPDRDSLCNYVKELAPWAQGGISPIQGGDDHAQAKLQAIDPKQYGKSRNFGNGKITRLSPYLHHGILTLNQVRNLALDISDHPDQIIKFIQELAWRDFWQRVADQNPDWLWQDIEPYKTGFTADDYQNDLPDDIANGSTDLACLNHFIRDLLDTGYIHNHARMYLASYIIHFRRIKWQAGAKWFLSHLLDGDEASNNLSWQWIASTFSQKPYIFNLENVQTYFGPDIDTRAANNKMLDASYEQLAADLFPNLRRGNG